MRRSPWQQRSPFRREPSEESEKRPEDVEKSRFQDLNDSKSCESEKSERKPSISVIRSGKRTPEITVVESEEKTTVQLERVTINFPNGKGKLSHAMDSAGKPPKSRLSKSQAKVITHFCMHNQLY